MVVDLRGQFSFISDTNTQNFEGKILRKNLISQRIVRKLLVDGYYIADSQAILQALALLYIVVKCWEKGTVSCHLTCIELSCS